MGIRRYGFHGISYTYLMRELERLTDGETAKGKIIFKNHKKFNNNGNKK
ncbi:hypothetical protein [Chryseobacterium salivictor]